jgi:hypothetical protein
MAYVGGVSSFPMAGCICGEAAANYKGPRVIVFACTVNTHIGTGEFRAECWGAGLDLRRLYIVMESRVRVYFACCFAHLGFCCDLVYCYILITSQDGYYQWRQSTKSCQ